MLIPQSPTKCRVFLILASAAWLTACASGSTFRSGVGDTDLQRPPWYAGRQVSTDSAIGHFPVVYQRGATQPPGFEPAGNPESPMAWMLSEMNRYLDSLGISVRLGEAGSPALPGTPPNVEFGCETPGRFDCEAPEDAGRGLTMRLAVGRPSAEWVALAAGAMDGAGVSRALVITLEIGHYWIRQSGLRGDKSVELGTGYSVSLPWLTSLEAPVPVLQLTGALVGRDGRALRIGAEGMLARRTSLPLAALGAQAMITDNEVEQLRTLRRNDIAGAPLVWQAALRQLVTSLTGR